MSVYVVGQLDVHDPAGYAAYLAGFMPGFERHGGVLLATSRKKTEVLEGEWALPRTVLMRFPDRASAMAWYTGPEYRALATIRRRTARTNLVIVGGKDPADPAAGGS